MTRNERTTLWRSRIASYQSRTGTADVWCERNQVSLFQLYYWQRKLKSTSTSEAPNRQTWIPLLTGNIAPADTESLIVTIGCARIEVNPGFDAAHLADVVRTLKSLC